MMTTLSNIAPLFQILSEALQPEQTKAKKESSKKKPFAVHIDVVKNSTLLNSFIKSLKEYDKLSFKETFFTEVNMIDLTGIGDVILFGQDKDKDVTVAFWEELPVEVKQETKEYVLSDNLSKIYSAINDYIKANYPQKNKQPKFMDNNKVIHLGNDVRRHHRFVRIGYEHYSIQEDFFGNEYITIEGTNYFLI